MGLDMYLLPTEDWSEDELAYWRKANQIHFWFVQNVQNNVDDCEVYPVTKAKLIQLHNTVKEVLADHTKATTLLPTMPGFFFGSIDYNEYYYQDLEETDEKLKKILSTLNDNSIVYYCSSW